MGIEIQGTIVLYHGISVMSCVFFHHFCHGAKLDSNFLEMKIDFHCHLELDS